MWLVVAMLEITKINFLKKIYEEYTAFKKYVNQERQIQVENESNKILYSRKQIPESNSDLADRVKPNHKQLVGKTRKPLN